MGVYSQLDGNGIGEENAWLACHVTLMTDGTFTVAVDYSAEYANIQTDNGTWTKGEDGSLALTGTRDFTALATDNGNGTVTYTMEVVNAETNITCEVSGTTAGNA